MTILDTILKYKKTEVEKQKNLCNINELINNCKKSTETKSFLDILKKNKAYHKISLIAEVKKASPSKGVIKENFNPVEIAEIYQKAGASAISVLTDEKFFQGSIKYLKDIKKIAKIPVLRKDFIIDEYQIYQTREMGADIILLIAAALEKKQLKDFYNMSKELGLDVLLEVHDKEEFDFALEINAEIIGINNRNLKTFEISLNHTVDLIKNIKLNNKYIISESGIENSENVTFLKNYGVDGILVGESLIKSNHIEKAVINLLK